MPVVGEGTYGCVHKPSLECKEPNIDYNNKVSKIMTTSAANDELKEFKLLNKVDKENNHFLGTPVKCNVKHTIKNINEILKCKDREKYNPQKYGKMVNLLIMEDGGVNCEDYLYKIRKSTINNELKKNKLEIFYIHFYNILKSVEFFNKKKIAHRDIKLQNIVYNDETETMKLIDFGLLTRYKTAVEEAKKDEYWLNYFFWSIPPFAIFANKSKYNNVLKFIGKPTDKDYDKRLDKYTKTLIDELDNNTSMNNVFYNLIINRRKNFNTSNLKKTFHKSFANMISKLHLYSHKEYLKRLFNANDVYNLGMALLHSITIIEPEFHTNKTYFLNIQFIKKLVDLSFKMLSFDVFDSISISETITQYKLILLQHIILDKYNYEFKNETIVPKKEEVKSKMDVSIITPFEFTKDEKICPSEKELNPNTNRCVNKCKDDFIRNDKFKCVKNKTMKKICPSEKELNPNTNRCVNKCKDGFIRNDKFKCVKNKTMKK